MTNPGLGQGFGADLFDQLLELIGHGGGHFRLQQAAQQNMPLFQIMFLFIAHKTVFSIEGPAGLLVKWGKNCYIPSMDDLYSNDLLAEAGALPEARRLQAAMASARKVSRVCGSEISVDLSLEKGRVSEFAMRVKACALGQASAAIVSRHIKGESAKILREIRDAMWAMLKGERDLPDFPGWDDLQKLVPIKSYPARHVSTMLIFDAVVDCLDQIEAEKNPKQQKCNHDE